METHDESASAQGHTVDVTTIDRRLYVPSPDGWEVRIKRGWDKDYCFLKNPGEDFFHLLMHGELYVQQGDEKYCLNCAVRRNIVTDDRLNWQHRPKAPSSTPIADV